MLGLPPYTLATIDFRFRSLAALAARTALPADRDAALAALICARLLGATLPPVSLDGGLRAQRSAAARNWLLSLTAIPTAARAHFVKAVDSSASDDPRTWNAGAESIIRGVAQLLDPSSNAELRRLARALLSTTT